VWIPVLPVLLELLPHAATRCEDHRYEVHTKLLASEFIIIISRAGMGTVALRRRCPPRAEQHINEAVYVCLGCLGMGGA
jgi:hypothetical protein